MVTSVLIENLRDYMDESFLKKACAAIGEYEIVGIRVIRKKDAEKTAGYGFLQFIDGASAAAFVERLQGKNIPLTKPPVRFKLSIPAQRVATTQEFAFWVQDLDPSITDERFRREFESRYGSVRSAKILRFSNGQSKGVGFVRFGDITDYHDALDRMDGCGDFGSRPVKVVPAVLEEQDELTEPLSPEEFQVSSAKDIWNRRSDKNRYNKGPVPTMSASQWSNTTGWIGFEDPLEAHHYIGQATANVPYVPLSKECSADVAMIAPGVERLRACPTADFYDEHTLVDYDIPIDVDSLNRATMRNAKKFWNAFDDTRWYTPGIDMRRVDETPTEVK